ncbi:MAG: DUF2934 domain-containing protein [Variovorax sp.]
MPRKTASAAATAPATAPAPPVDPTAAAAENATPSSADLPTAADAPSREESIRKAAYEAFLRRGDGSGSEVDDWIEAEKLIDGKG